MRRSRTLPVAPVSDPRLNYLLRPVSGPNAIPPSKMTPRERQEEIIAILAHGMLRKLRGIPPFTRPTVNDSAKPPLRSG